MHYEIRFGTDGIGLKYGDVFADSLDEARLKAEAKLLADPKYSYVGQHGDFSVHGQRPRTIVTLSADAYAQRITDSAANRPTLRSAEA